MSVTVTNVCYKNLEALVDFKIFVRKRTKTPFKIRFNVSDILWGLKGILKGILKGVLKGILKGVLKGILKGVPQVSLGFNGQWRSNGQWSKHSPLQHTFTIGSPFNNGHLVRKLSATVIQPWASRQ
jgi:hypothetical protein